MEDTGDEREVELREYLGWEVTWRAICYREWEDGSSVGGSLQ